MYQYNSKSYDWMWLANIIFYSIEPPPKQFKLSKKSSIPDGTKFDAGLSTAEKTKKISKAFEFVIQQEELGLWNPDSAARGFIERHQKINACFKDHFFCDINNFVQKYPKKLKIGNYGHQCECEFVKKSSLSEGMLVWWWDMEFEDNLCGLVGMW